MAEKKPAKKTTQSSAERTAASKSETFTAEERAAMKARARGAEGGSACEQEQGGRGARRCSRQIAEMTGSDRL